MRFAVIVAVLMLLHMPTRAGESHYLDELEAALSGPSATETVDAEASAPVRNATPAASSGTTPGDGLFPELRVRITARRHTVLSSQGTGRIEEVAARDGDRFDEGDVLVRMDDAPLRLQRSRAAAALSRQEVLYRMVRELADMQSKGEAEVEVARMEMEQARAELQAVELFLDRTAVAAPFPGRVADVFVREMQYVPEGTPLLEILDDSTLELEFIVPSVWIRWFTPGFRFEVVVEETGRRHEAVLERLGGKVDPLSQSVKAYATLLASDPALMEGMSGSAAIEPPAGAAD